MTRSSIVGPIILILIGGLFLANNLRPDIPMLEFLGRFWPFMLIALGSGSIGRNPYLDPAR